MSLDKLFANEIDRRDFLRKSTDVGLGLAGLLYGVDRFANFLENSLEGKLSLSPQEAEAMGCAPGLLYFKEEPPVIYPPLKGHKVQPPEDGCLIGFFSEYAIMMPGFRRNTDTTSFIDRYDNQLGKKPFILSLLGHHRIFADFPTEDAVSTASRGVTPLIYAEVGSVKLEDIASGKHDRGIKKFADGAVKFGEEYGGFFVCTMREMNIGREYCPGPWGGQPKTAKKVWKHMWQIFEDNGANQYATWVWEVYCPEIRGGRFVDNPEMYYPGDQYVDWIGLSAYSRSGFSSGAQSFGNLVHPTYSQMRRNHKEKPVMMAEFGKTEDKRQPKWIRNAYETMKSWPGMKAAIYWDNMNWELRDDHMLSQESYQVLGGVFKDPYFVGAKTKF